MDGPEIDALLPPYIHAKHEADSERLIAALISEARPAEGKKRPLRCHLSSHYRCDLCHILPVTDLVTTRRELHYVMRVMTAHPPVQRRGGSGRAFN